MTTGLPDPGPLSSSSLEELLAFVPVLSILGRRKVKAPRSRQPGILAGAWDTEKTRDQRKTTGQGNRLCQISVFSISSPKWEGAHSWLAAGLFFGTVHQAGAGEACGYDTVPRPGSVHLGRSSDGGCGGQDSQMTSNDPHPSKFPPLVCG